jgi:hypothetical protein
MDGLNTVVDDDDDYDDDDEKILQYPKKLSHFILCRLFILRYLFNVLLNHRFLPYCFCYLLFFHE